MTYKLVLACSLLLVPTLAHARPTLRGAPLAAVAIPEAGNQPRTTVRSVHALLQTELKRHGIRVKSRLVPRRVSVRRRGLAAYARAHRLRRVYELRMLPVGEKLVVMLDEKRGRRMRKSYSAKLAAENVEQLDLVVPRLVAAVVERREPEPLPPPKPPVVAAADTGTATDESPAAAVTAEGTPRQTEWLWGFSVHPGSFLRAAAGLYGGSAALYYDMRPWRVGIEAGGMGGSGRVLTASARGHYLFDLGEKTTPMVGAGLGFMMLTNEQDGSGSGVSFSLTGGAQLAHLKAATLVAELEFILPLFTAARQDAENDNGIVDIVKHTRWSPAVLARLSCLF